LSVHLNGPNYILSSPPHPNPLPSGERIRVRGKEGTYSLLTDISVEILLALGYSGFEAEQIVESDFELSIILQQAEKP
jgi:hypothetical protein